MKSSAIVRFKGTPWNAVITPASSEEKVGHSPITDEDLGNNSKAMLLDLAFRHFQRLRLSASEAKKLALALKKCIKGETVDVGPIGRSGSTYNFRRKANAICIRVGEGSMRLPLDAAAALVKPLKFSAAPRLVAKAG